ncbi:ABC transporter permease [Paenibacillus sp. YYML68]|uniref:ABC transporter permease n=1 Tax=Paenibacillus sp. YYML68 TaxID=2909250 RepID=UPI0024919630|nr:ABC transporter permease [Paenibacillus sp. YYML68]
MSRSSMSRSHQPDSPAVEPLTLWRRRSTAFSQEIRPYLVYALQSLSLIIVVAFLGLMYTYDRILPEAPPGFPFAELITAILVPVMAITPIRTYVRAADLVFLIPLENELKATYMKHAVHRAFLAQSALLLLLWLAVWPAYIQIEGAKPGFWHVLLVLIAMKRLLLQAKWAELQYSDIYELVMWRAARWAAALGGVYGLLVLKPGLGSLLVAAVGFAYLFVIRSTARASMNWNRLADTELAHRSFIFRLLNQFVDVGHVQSRPRNRRFPRRLLAVLAGLRFRSTDTYRYLYVRVWLRSELFGITIRLWSIGAGLLLSSSGDWVPSALYLLFVWLVGVQLQELPKAYLHSDWSYIYPLPAELRAVSVQRLIRTIHMLLTAALSVPLLLVMNHFTNGLLVTAAGLGIVLLRRLRRQTRT